ncbi:hypothetical protein B0H11DRAFT_1928099 [Mycena galericulata]|nr:hypothetical protein B0H11DRAFT_1928099 [Mycena galericulata]
MLVFTTILSALLSLLVLSPLGTIGFVDLSEIVIGGGKFCDAHQLTVANVTDSDTLLTNISIAELPLQPQSCKAEIGSLRVQTSISGGEEEPLNDTTVPPATRHTVLSVGSVVIILVTLAVVSFVMDHRAGVVNLTSAQTYQPMTSSFLRMGATDQIYTGDVDVLLEVFYMRAKHFCSSSISGARLMYAQQVFYGLSTVCPFQNINDVRLQHQRLQHVSISIENATRLADVLILLSDETVLV